MLLSHDTMVLLLRFPRPQVSLSSTQPSRERQWRILTAPQSFLHLISLRTATELITLTLLVNKVTGLYGILAIFTGYDLNPLQLSHYIYSLVILVLVGWLGPSIKKPEEPLKNVALAWIYVLDTVVNSAYTALFGAGWFIVLAQNLDSSPIGPGDVENTPGAGTIDDTAGFTSPEFNATHKAIN